MTIGSILKKCLSCVLAIALLVSVVAPVSAVTATVSEGYDAGYVALGDAMTLGIGLEDESTEAYYALVAKALSDAGLIDDPDDIYSHANKKYRVEEIRYLVDYDYAGDGYTAAIGSLSALRKTGMVKEYVTNADVITINAGVNNFSTYIIEQMLYYVENKGAVKYSYSFDEFADADVQEALDNVKSIVMEKLKGAADDQGDEVLDLINFVAEVSTYAILSYVTSFNAMIAGIYELNPDVDVYVVGIYNFAQGESVSINGKELKMTYNGKEFAVDDFFGALVELANAYTQILAPRKYDYTYVDPGHPELLIDRMGNTNLSDDERIPDGLILELVELAGDAAVNEVIDIFAQYGIEKTEQWALGFLQELIDCDSDEERAEFIMDELNSYVVDEIIDTFQAELLEYLGQFATGEDVVTKDDVQKLLSDLDAAADLAEREAVAAEFVDDLIADPDLQNQAAAKVIHGYIDQYGLSGYVTVENVIVLLEELGECETEEQRKTTANDWVKNLAVTKITEYVQNVVGPENYSTTDASNMLKEMNDDPDNAAAIARDCLLVDAFHGYMVAKFTETYTENGLVISTYATIDAFVTAVESAATIDYAAEIVRTEVRYAAAGKVAADDTFKTWLGSTMTAADIAELFGGMDAASDEYAYLTEWMYDLFNADPSSNNFIIEYLIDLFASAYVSYDNAATAAVNAVTKYLEGLETASNAFGEYVDIQSEIVDKILEVYEDNCTGEGLDLSGFADFDELRTTAISKILDGYEEYRKAIDTAMSSADSFNEYLDPVYDMLKEIAAVDVISLNDLMSVKDKVVAGGGTYIEDLRDRLVVSQDLADDELTAAYIVLRYYLADGMMIMPSVDGHATIANQIIKAVNGENTGSAAGNLANKVIDKAIDIYHLAKKYLSKPTTGSGQTTVLINPENYVALGDNITSGTALPNGTKTYVDLLSEALAMEFNDVADIDKDIISNLAINGMRTEELLALVDSNYNGDAYTEAKFDIPSLRAEYMEAITSAELITIEIGINNLVTYPMTQALLAYNGEDIYEMDWAQYFAQSRVDQVSAGKEAVMNLILHAIDNADSRLEDATGKSAYDECETALNTVATAVEALAYGVLGYMVNLDASVEAIAEANPDATIVLVGFYNPMVDTYIQIDEPVNIAGHSIDLSEYKVNTSAITAKVINQANRFLTNFVGFYADDLTAANEQSRIVTVSILNTELCISDSDASKDLSTLTDWKTVNVAGKEVTLKVPEYLLETLSTGGSALHPNAAGHEYIYNQILAALDYEIHADVIPEDNTKVYGEADPDLTYVMDDMSSLYELVVSLKREEGEDVGEYDIIATVVENGGYAEVDVVVGTFTITKRPVSVHVVVLDGEIDDVSVTGGSIADRDTNEDLTTLLGLVVDGNTVTASEDGNYDTEVTYEFHTSTPEDVDVYIKSYYSINDGTDFSYYGDTVPGFYAYAMFQNGDPVPADFNIVLDEVPVTGSPVGEYTISFTYTDVEGYNVVETVYCTWEIKARPISVDVTVVDGVITDVQITDGSIPACDEWDGTTAGLVDLLGLEVNAEATAVTDSNSNYNVTITSDFQSSYVPDYVCWNTTTGKYYEIVHLAVLEANEGETIEMIKNSDQTLLTDIYHYAGSVNLINGVTLDLKEFELTLDSLFAAEGNYVIGDYETTDGAGARLHVPHENLVLTEAFFEGYFNGAEMRVMPLWVEGEGYVFGRFGIFDNNNDDRGLWIDEANDTIYFQFKHTATGYLNQNYIKDNGLADNKMKVVVYLQWESEEGVAYQTFVFDDDIVSQCTGGYDYTFKLTNFSELNISVDTLSISAGIVAECGLSAFGNTYSGALVGPDDSNTSPAIEYEFATSDGYVCWNPNIGVDGKYYKVVHEAVLEASAGDTIYMISNSDQTALTDICPSAGMVNLMNGVILDLQNYVLKLDSLVVSDGSYVIADYEASYGAGGRLIVPEDNLVLSGGYYEGDYKEAEMRVLPVWLAEQGCYVFGRFGIFDNNNDDRGLWIDEANDTIYFQFKHTATGYLNQNYIKDNGLADNKIKVIVYLQWESEEGVAYQTFVFDDEIVSQCTGGYDYTFTLTNYSELNINAATLQITAQVISNSGAIAYGNTLTAENNKQN